MPEAPPTPQMPKSPRPALTLDIDHYQALFDAPELTQDQKREMLEALWSLIVSFVDLGFDVSASETCGKHQNTPALCAFARASLVKSEHSDPSEDKEANDV